MSIVKQIQSFILPQEINFFSRLQEQSASTKEIIEALHGKYIAGAGTDSFLLKNVIQHSQDIRRRNLHELYQVFITPVDKEAISRAYVNLDWVVMSIEHLEIELTAYGVNDLSDYKLIFDLLKEEMKEIHAGFGMLGQKDDDDFSRHIFNIVHCDNKLIEEYVHQLSILLKENDFKKIIIYKEILMQLKEVSKRIRICANDLQDMLFKMI